MGYWQVIDLRKKYNKCNRHSIPFALQRLHSNAQKYNGIEIDTNELPKNKCTYDKYTIDGKRVVYTIPLSIFQDRLVGHFDIWFNKYEIVWPKRMKTPSAI